MSQTRFEVTYIFLENLCFKPLAKSSNNKQNESPGNKINGGDIRQGRFLWRHVIKSVFCTSIFLTTVGTWLYVRIVCVRCIVLWCQRPCESLSHHPKFLEYKENLSNLSPLNLQWRAGRIVWTFKISNINLAIEKNEMGGACGAYGGGEGCAQGSVWETWGKETTGETQT